MTNNTLLFIILFSSLAYIFVSWWVRKNKSKTVVYQVVPDSRVELDCHWCAQQIMKLKVYRNCPNCLEQHVFHTECGANLYTKQHRCRGIYVGHKSGHNRSLTNPNVCATCKLDKDKWVDWHCASGVQELSRKAKFSSKDEEFLKSLGATIKEPTKETVL